MSVFNKRNALVGFITVKAASRWLGRRSNRRRSGLKTAGFVALGVVSLGIVAAVAAAILRRRGESDELTAEGGAEDESGIVGEHVTLPAEPIPAT